MSSDPNAHEMKLTAAGKPICSCQVRLADLNDAEAHADWAQDNYTLVTSDALSRELADRQRQRKQPLDRSTRKTLAQLDREIGDVLETKGARVVADLARWGVDRPLVDEVRQAFRVGDHRRAMALARDLGWNRAAKRGRST